MKINEHNINNTRYSADEKSIEYNRLLVFVFDFHKAFDMVDLNAILEALREYGIDYRYSNLIHI